MSKLNRITMKADGAAEVMIYDEIGSSWFSDGVTAKGFAEQLKSMGDVKNIDVRINSPGGSVFEGLAIYNTLANHPASVTVHIDGLAASIATVIAMAGDTINMAENAMFMIHEPRAVVAGTADDMLSMASTLEALTTSATGVYASRSTMPEADVRAAMKSETWYSAAQAKAAGFVDSVTPNKAITAKFDPKQFSNVPEWARVRLALDPEPEPETAPAAEKEPETMHPETQPSVDVEAIKAQAKAEERERQTKIVALCNAAKRPELAAKFCEDDSISVSDVQAKLFEALCKANGPLGDEGGTAGDTKPADDGNDKYRAEFKASPAYAKAMSEAEYIAMRRVDDGLDQLQIGPNK